MSVGGGWGEWVLLGMGAGLVYCAGFVATFAIQVRTCPRHRDGHRWEEATGYQGNTRTRCCTHTLSFDRNAWPWLWPLAVVGGVVVGAVVVPFVGPVWAVRQACHRVERRLVARHAPASGVEVVSGAGSE